MPEAAGQNGTNPHGTNPHGTDRHGTDRHGTDQQGAHQHSTGRSGTDRPKSPYNAALDLLAQRAYSRAELGRRLTRRGFTPEAVEATLVRLEKARLLDEEAYAAAFAASRAARGVAATVIRRDLTAKGVDSVLATRAAAEASPADQEAERCRDLAASWLRRRADLPAHVAARRLSGYLARRGYRPGVIAGVVRALVADDLPAEAD